MSSTETPLCSSVGGKKQISLYFKISFLIVK
jgi:hypothetical protein